MLHRTTIRCREREVKASHGLPKSSQKLLWALLGSSPRQGGASQGSPVYLATPQGALPTLSSMRHCLGKVRK